MKTFFRGHFVITGGALVGLAVAYALLLLVGGFLIWHVQMIHEEQAHISRVAAKTCSAEKRFRTGFEAFVLNQPNLDVRVLTILQEVARTLPEVCKP